MALRWRLVVCVARWLCTVKYYKNSLHNKEMLFVPYDLCLFRTEGKTEGLKLVYMCGCSKYF